MGFLDKFGKMTAFAVTPSRDELSFQNFIPLNAMKF
jgi:hypothetical protein